MRSERIVRSEKTFENCVLERAREGFVEGRISGLHLESLALSGKFPATKLVVVFAHDNRPTCRFGVQFPIWEDIESVSDEDPDIVVSILLAGIQEQIEAADLGLPADCSRRSITWIDG